jgi:hypothetical protein
MTTLPPLLTEALAAISADTEVQMGELIGDFAVLPLSEEDRLSALAGVVATIAVTRYSRHRDVFVAALRSWALEISIAIAPPPPRLTHGGPPGRVGEAQHVLLTGIDDILRKMMKTGSEKHHRLVTELAVMARLLGRYDSQSIYLVLNAASSAYADPIWGGGDDVPISLGETWLPVVRDVNLETVAPRGTA